MRLTTSPEALPGSCIFCGSGSRGLYLDTGLDVEFHGAMYICVDECLAGMGNLAGFLVPSVHKRYEAALKGVYNQVLRLQEENARLREENAVLRNSGFQPDRIADYGLSDSRVSLPGVETYLEVTGGGEEAESGDDSDPPEPVNVTQLDRVRSGSARTKRDSVLDGL